MININELQTWLKACVGGTDIMTMGLLCHLIITSDFTGDRLTQMPSLEFETGFSKNKLHRRLKTLEERGAISKTKFHRRGIGIKIKECDLIGNSKRNANETQSETKQNLDETMGIFLKNILQQAVNQGVANTLNDKNILKDNAIPQPDGTQSEANARQCCDELATIVEREWAESRESVFSSVAKNEQEGMNNDLYNNISFNYLYAENETCGTEFEPSRVTHAPYACAGALTNKNLINKKNNILFPYAPGVEYKTAHTCAGARDDDIPTEPYTQPSGQQWHPVVVPFPRETKEVIEAATLRGIAMKEDEAQAFMDYNEARGWILSGTRIMDWRKLLPNWHKQHEEKELRRKNHATGYAGNSRWDNKTVAHDGEFGPGDEIA